MKHILSILLSAILCAAASAQTIKTLGYNTTNGQVVANTTNALHFTNDSIAFNVGDLSVSNGAFFWGGQPRWAPEDNSFDLPLAFNGTNTAAATRTNLGLGATGSVSFEEILISNAAEVAGGAPGGITIDADGIQFGATNAATTRTNLGLPLAALTNDSNVTMMRALGGSTNTNEPFSGLLTFIDDAAGTNTITVSNGIILKLETQ